MPPTWKAVSARPLICRNDTADSKTEQAVIQAGHKGMICQIISLKRKKPPEKTVAFCIFIHARDHALNGS